MDGTNGMPIEVYHPAAKVLFRAIVSRRWPAGLVPVFAHQIGGSFRLSRTPVAGREADEEPLFFGWPCDKESQPVRINGHWAVQTKRGDGSKIRFALDLASVGGLIFGRFDPDTDYRFASINGGNARV